MHIKKYLHSYLLKVFREIQTKYKNIHKPNNNT